MTHKVLAIFFSIVFISLVTAPTLITIIDDNADIALFFEYSEEEEKGKETNIKIEIAVVEVHSVISEQLLNKTSSELRYIIKTYNTPHLNFILPPPEGTV